MTVTDVRTWKEQSLKDEILNTEKYIYQFRDRR